VGVNSGTSSTMKTPVGLKAPAQAEILVEPSVMDVAPTTTMVGPIVPIGAISPNAKFVTNWATLPSHVLNSIHKMSLSIVLKLQMARTTIGYLIRPLLIISRVISPIYLFIPNMMELTK
jgi:hypothetical protein